MNPFSPRSHMAHSRTTTWLSAFALWILAGVFAYSQPASPTKTVVYSPVTKSLQGQLPYSESYTLKITSPTYSLTWPATVTLEKSSSVRPDEVSAATALSYLTFSDPVTDLPISTLYFTASGQSRNVKVTLALAADAMAGSYAYEIIATGWPSGTGQNTGSSIGATITAAAVLQKPVVQISAPLDGSTISIGIADLPYEVAFAFTAMSPGENPSPITSVTVNHNGTPVQLSELNGVGTSTVAGSGTLVVTAAGQQTLTVSATNAGGSVSTSNIFTVIVTAPPPTVAIDTPENNATFTYYAGNPPLQIDFQSTGLSTASPLRSMTAKLDGQDIALGVAGLGTLRAVGTATLPFNTGGTHSLAVTAWDDYNSATASSVFTINVITPVPTIAIDDPLEGQIFEHTVGTQNLNIPFAFHANTTAGFTIGSVSATLNGSPVTIATTTGIGTQSVAGSGTLPGVPAGTHILAATAVSGGVPVSTSVTFSVVDVAPAGPPTVVIHSPADPTYSLNGGPLTIPLSFTGASNASSGVITDMSAQLNGVPVTVAWPAGQNAATASGSLLVSSPGEYTVEVTATNLVGTSTTSKSYTVVEGGKSVVQGSVFLDVNYNGVREGATEPGLSGFAVQLFNETGQTLLQETTTGAGGAYAFEVDSGAYLIVINGAVGLSATSINEHDFAVQGRDVVLPDTGFGLNFAAIRTLSAEGMSHGFWKNNLVKAVSGKTGGIQVSVDTLQAHTATVRALALAPFGELTMNSAVSILSGRDQLALQLLASEYNYAHGAYIGGSGPLTHAFITWGEAILANPSGYSASYQNFAKDWFDAYNNSHGGRVLGPLP